MACPAYIAEYVTDLPYPPLFHREMVPVWLNAIATIGGFRSPDITRPYRSCELGCGSGLTALLSAAANPSGHFTAIDFNAAQIEGARQLAISHGLHNIEFLHAGFNELDLDDAGPRFHYIVLHGVWSWVSAATQQALLRFLDRRLLPGGLVYLAYMTHPGSSSLMALQRLIYEHACRLPGDSQEKLAAALSLVRRLGNAGTGYLAEYPGLRRQIQAMLGERPEYLAHEFLTASWCPQHVGEVIRQFDTIGCHYIGSATPPENIDVLSIPGQTLPLLQDIDDLATAETLRDIARNQSQRRDIYQRDATLLSQADRRLAIEALRIASLPGMPASTELVFQTRIGPVPGPAEIFDPLLRALSQGPQWVRTLQQRAPFDTEPELLNQALQMLVAAGHAHWLVPDNAHASTTQADMHIEGWQVLSRQGTAVPYIS